MKLSTFFKTRKGTGILATADKQGKTDIAVYSQPHIISAKKVAFIMRDQLSYKNVSTNPKASYLFLEDKPGHKGIRLYLTRVGEESDQTKVLSERRRSKPLAKKEKIHLVYFRVDKARSAVGDTVYKLS